MRRQLEEPETASGRSDRRRIPTVIRLGAVVIVAGLIGDLVEHAFVSHIGEAMLGRFPIPEHIAHLVVLVGMVLVLVGIMA
ncbi:MAG TPA: hypothetical protein VFP19_03725, partial [Candidatus Limnocylindrales bacterium]|nr:hypothetical protein [Candidatus Limnocylindrales bacterium]